MELIAVLDHVPAVLVLTAGLVLLVRRRAVLGKPGAVAVAGVAVLLAGAVADAVLGFTAFHTLAGGSPWWVEVVDAVLVPADLLGLPLLAWAVLAGRRRPAAVPS